jgi:hypothetical protein
LIPWKIDEIKKDVKSMERESEFIKETMQREASFREEEQQLEIEFRKGIEQRELKNKKIIEELTSIFAEGKTPDTVRLFRELSED